MSLAFSSRFPVFFSVHEKVSLSFVMGCTPCKGFTHRTEVLYDLYDLYDLYVLYDLYDLYAV